MCSARNRRCRLPPRTGPTAKGQIRHAEGRRRRCIGHTATGALGLEAGFDGVRQLIKGVGVEGARHRQQPLLKRRGVEAAAALRERLPQRRR